MTDDRIVLNFLAFPVLLLSLLTYCRVSNLTTKVADLFRIEYDK